MSLVCLGRKNMYTSEEECGLRLHRRGLGPESPGGVASEPGLERKVGPGNCRRHPYLPQGAWATSKYLLELGTSSPPGCHCSSTIKALLHLPATCPTVVTHWSHTGLSQGSSDNPINSYLWLHHFFEKMMLLLTFLPFLVPSKLLIRRPDDTGRGKPQACPLAAQHRHPRASHFTSHTYLDSL